MATAGAAAWVVPEILTAKPAAGATMSGTHGGTTGGGGTTGSGSNPVTNPATTPGATTGNLTAATSPTAPGKSLAFTGIDVKRDAEIGAALIAGGWAMHHWASRAPKPAAEVHEAGSSDRPI